MHIDTSRLSVIPLKSGNSFLISIKLLHLTKSHLQYRVCVIRHETGEDVSQATFSHRSMRREMFGKNEISELHPCDLQYQAAVRAVPRCVF